MYKICINVKYVSKITKYNKCFVSQKSHRKWVWYKMWMSRIRYTTMIYYVDLELKTLRLTIWEG